jgi:hypothetical protein
LLFKSLLSRHDLHAIPEFMCVSVKTQRQLLSAIKRNGEIRTLQIEANGLLYASQGSSLGVPLSQLGQLLDVLRPILQIHYFPPGAATALNFDIPEAHLSGT